jgi:tetratricopeptide (TPR) repeat protein
MAEIYQSQGRPTAAYKALKNYLLLNPSARLDEELQNISRGIYSSPSVFPNDSGWEQDQLNKDEFLKSFLRQTVQKMKEYEDEYSHLKMTWDEKESDDHSPDFFPITLVMGENVLGVVFVTMDDYIVLLEDVSIMYKDYLHYQNPYLISGILLGMKGHYQEAAEQFQEAIGIDPTNAKAYNNLGITFFKMGKFEDSRDYFLTALELQPGNIFAHNNLGLTYLKLGANKKAEEQFKCTLFAEPHNLPAHFFLGYLFFQEGRFSQAERYYRNANDIDSSLPQVNYALGRVMIGLGKWEWAIDYFQKAIALDKTFLKAYVSLGGIFTRKKMYQEAEDMFNKAIELEPDYAVAYYNLACAFAVQNKNREAINNLEKAIKRGFSDRDLIQQDKELDNIRTDPAFVKLLIEQVWNKE